LGVLPVHPKKLGTSHMVIIHIYLLAMISPKAP
jgi:hypothetical protein